jgi:hypothetical protein
MNMQLLDAHVYAEVMQGSKILTVLNENTDNLGMFTFSPLAVGEYRVSADKQEAGYLATRPNIFIPKPPLTIVLAPDTPTATTIIRFSPQSGYYHGMGERFSYGQVDCCSLELSSAGQFRLVNHRHCWAI